MREDIQIKKLESQKHFYNMISTIKTIMWTEDIYGKKRQNNHWVFLSVGQIHAYFIKPSYIYKFFWITTWKWWENFLLFAFASLTSLGLIHSSFHNGGLGKYVSQREYFPRRKELSNKIKLLFLFLNSGNSQHLHSPLHFLILKATLWEWKIGYQL